jgi:hypothetical protein
MNSNMSDQRGNYDHTLTQQERSLVKTLGMYKGNFGKPILDQDEVCGGCSALGVGVAYCV